MSDSMWDITRLSGSLGAEIRGVDLGSPSDADIKDIKAIVDLMKKNSMTEFEMEKGDFKIRLQRDGKTGKLGPSPEPVVIQTPSVVQTPTALAAATPAPAPAPITAEVEKAALANSGIEVKSPMIGTFYRRPSPDADQYAEIGTQVEPDAVEVARHLELKVRRRDRPHVEDPVERPRRLGDGRTNGIRRPALGPFGMGDTVSLLEPCSRLCKQY